jgi:hypothetical protein
MFKLHILHYVLVDRSEQEIEHVTEW